MKRILCIMLLFALAVALGACRADLKDDRPHLTGKVLEVFDGGCLLEITEQDSPYMAVGGEVVVHTNVEGCPAYAVGDLLTVFFDGSMATSYPPQIFKVYAVEKVT